MASLLACPCRSVYSVRSAGKRNWPSRILAGEPGSKVFHLGLWATSRASQCWTCRSEAVAVIRAGRERRHASGTAAFDRTACSPAARQLACGACGLSGAIVPPKHAAESTGVTRLRHV